MKRASLAIIVAGLSFCLSAAAQTKHYEAPAFIAEFPGQDEIKYSEQTTKDADGNPITLDTYSQQFDNNFAGIMYYMGTQQKQFNADKGVDGMLHGMCTDQNGKVSDFVRRAAKIGFADGEQVKFVCTLSDGKPLYAIARFAFIAPSTLWLADWVTDDDQTARGEAFLDSIIVKRR